MRLKSLWIQHSKMVFLQKRYVIYCHGQWGGGKRLSDSCFTFITWLLTHVTAEVQGTKEKAELQRTPISTARSTTLVTHVQKTAPFPATHSGHVGPGFSGCYQRGHQIHFYEAPTNIRWRLQDDQQHTIAEYSAESIGESATHQELQKSGLKQIGEQFFHLPDVYPSIP